MENKKSILLGTFLLNCISLSACASNAVVNLPKSKKAMHIRNDIAKRIGTKAADVLNEFVQDTESEDCVYSPASFALAISALAVVSDNMDISCFGFTDPEEDVKQLLEAWNFEVEGEKQNTLFRSAVLHQQIGPKYSFDSEKQKKLADNYIASVVSTKDGYQKDAQRFFDKYVDLKLQVPNLPLTEDSGAATYAALKMRDSKLNGFGVYQDDFNFKNKVEKVDTVHFGSEEFPDDVRYYKGNNYAMFDMRISNTDLVILLPDEDANINNINIDGAYSNFLEHSSVVPAYGYIPYFHNTTNCANLSSIIDKINPHTSGFGFMSKLLKDTVVNDLKIKSILQSSDFEFDENGVKGESITVISLDPTSPAPNPEKPEPIVLNVDRPFIAYSTYDDFPLFINKVSNPGK